MGGNSQPPPTKWTISRRSPSDRLVSDHCSRGTMLRFSSTATRSCFMPNCSTSPESVSGGSKSRFSPLIWSFMGRGFSRSAPTVSSRAKSWFASRTTAPSKDPVALKLGKCPQGIFPCQPRENAFLHSSCPARIGVLRLRICFALRSSRCAQDDEAILSDSHGGAAAWSLPVKLPLCVTGTYGWRCGRNSWPAPEWRNPAEPIRPHRSSSRRRRPSR